MKGTRVAAELRNQPCLTTRRSPAVRIEAASTLTRPTNSETGPKSSALSPDELKAAVKAVGNRANAVQSYFKGERKAPHRAGVPTT